MGKRLFLPVVFFFAAAVLFLPVSVSANHTGSGMPACEDTSNLLGFPNWYRGLDCEDGGQGAVVFMGLGDLWIILMNVMDIAIRLAGLLAVVFIIYGGIRYTTSQGEPDSLQAAKKILTNAILGLIIAILAGTIVGFIAGQF